MVGDLCDSSARACTVAVNLKEEDVFAGLAAAGCCSRQRGGHG